MANKIQIRRDTAANWTAANTILANGEPGYETDTKRRKTGDGVSAWTALAYDDATAARPKLNTVVLLGDSITFNNGGVTGWWDARGWFFWANTLLGGRMNVLKNAGVSGNTTAQMLARIKTDVLDYNPGWVTVLAGTNDAGTDIPATTTIANLTAIYNAIVGNGGRVVAMTITPRNNMTAARAAELAKVNKWIKTYAQNNRSIYLCDVGAALVDTTAAGYQVPTAYAPDGLHPNATGAARMGKVLAATLDPLVPKSDLLMNGSGPDNLIPNPYFNGSGSTMPAGWGTQGGTPSNIAYVPRTDGVSGSWLQVTLANGTASTNIFQNLTLTSEFAPGDKVIFAVEAECDTLDPAPAADTQAFTAWIQFLVDSTWTKAYAGYWEAGYGNVPFPGPGGVFVTNPVTIPVGTTTVQAVINMKGGGKYRVHRATARKV